MFICRMILDASVSQAFWPPRSTLNYIKSRIITSSFGWLKSGRNLFSATPAGTRGFDLCVLINRTASTKLHFLNLFRNPNRTVYIRTDRDCKMTSINRPLPLNVVFILYKIWKPYDLNRMRLYCVATKKHLRTRTMTQMFSRQSDMTKPFFLL